MDPNTLAFVGVAITVAVVPGPDMALVTRNTLLGERRVGAATVVGIVGGILGWSLLAVAGIATIMAASAMPRARRVLRWATGTVLVGLGARVALDRA